MAETTKEQRAAIRRYWDAHKHLKAADLPDIVVAIPSLLADAERLAEVEAALQEEIDIRNRLEQVIRQQNGDGRAGLFVWDSDCGKVTNGGTIIDPDLDGTWYEESATIDPKWWHELEGE